MVTLGGVALDGVTLDGVALDGVTLDGVTLDGVTLDGVTLDGGLRVVTGNLDHTSFVKAPADQVNPETLWDSVSLIFCQSGILSNPEPPVEAWRLRGGFSRLLMVF